MIDAQSLTKNWEAVSAHGDQVPLFFYSTLFLTHPDVRDIFPVSMAQQRGRLVAALGHIVSHVDDLEAVSPMLRQLGRDHRKFGVVPEHYPAVREALLATLEHFSGDDWTGELARDWAAAYGIAADVMVQAAAAASSQPAWWNLTVLSIEHRCLDVAVLRVRPHAPLPYVAGQSIAVEIPTRPRLWRYYSPATLPAADGSFELHVRLVPGGPVSTAIVQAVQPGDVFRAGAPVGDRLTLPPGASGGLLLLAGGTGLAPMKALVEHLASARDSRQVHLFWGARFHRELYDLPAMRQVTDRLAEVSFVPCVSHEETDGVTAAAGTVVDVALGHGPWRDDDVYVCGSPGMVDATVAALVGAGTPPERVRREAFGNEVFGSDEFGSDEFGSERFGSERFGSEGFGSEEAGR